MMILLVVLGADVLALIAVFAWYLGAYQPNGGSVSGMMGQMMGGGATGGMTLAMPGGVWYALVGLFAFASVGLVALGYYVAYPEIPSGGATSQAVEKTAPAAERDMSWGVLMKTSKSEEKKVLEVLAAHEGHYLQKFIVKESGLSKLKTHRIVSRFAERGVVTVQRSGNTNEVALAPWVKREDPKAPAVS
jgi:hypothetical protein